MGYMGKCIGSIVSAAIVCAFIEALIMPAFASPGYSAFAANGPEYDYGNPIVWRPWTDQAKNHLISYNDISSIWSVYEARYSQVTAALAFEDIFYIIAHGNPWRISLRNDSGDWYGYLNEPVVARIMSGRDRLRIAILINCGAFNQIGPGTINYDLVGTASRNYGGGHCGFGLKNFGEGHPPMSYEYNWEHDIFDRGDYQSVYTAWVRATYHDFTGMIGFTDFIGDMNLYF